MVWKVSLLNMAPSTDRGYLEKVIASLGSRSLTYFFAAQHQSREAQTVPEPLGISFLPWTDDPRRGRAARQADQGSRQQRGDFPVKLCNRCGAGSTPGSGNRCPGCGKNPGNPLAALLQSPTSPDAVKRR